MRVSIAGTNALPIGRKAARVYGCEVAADRENAYLSVSRRMHLLRSECDG